MKSPVKSKFLNSINYFRGIAIIIIVMTHSYGIAHWNIHHNSSIFERFFYSLNLNGSVFFVFISGYLYHHIFYPRFNYNIFLLKKVKFVLLPYLFCSTLPIMYTVFDLHHEWIFNIVFDSGGRDFLPNTIQDRPSLAIIWFLVTGRAVYAYWFIPMVMILFAISPAINYLIKSPYLPQIILLMVTISMVIHRPVHNMNPLQALIYFLPIYLLGNYASINRQRILAFLKQKTVKIYLICLSILLGLVQVIIFDISGNFSKNFLAITVPDVNLIQKILLCFLLISVLEIWESTEIKSLKKTAETSFAIYFIHPFLIRPLTRLSRNLGFEFQGNILTLLIATMLMILLSIAIAQIIKLVFQKNSRYLIGW
ncbi:MAG: acyltransferase [Cyanobacteria bacterium P01_A01_bin.40]